MIEAGWRDAVTAYVRVEATPVDKFGHMPRLYALCSDIAASQRAVGDSLDDDVLFASAWMHDLGVFLGHRPRDEEALRVWDHVPYTIARSRDLLAGWGFPKGKLEAVAEAIRTHEAKYHAVLPEAVVLRDADILEQLGAIGALRAFVKVGRDSRFTTYSDVLPVLERNVRELPGKLRLARSRELAEARVAALEDLISAIGAESAGQLF